MSEISKNIGISIGDTIKLLWLVMARNEQINPKRLDDKYHELFPGRHVSYDYIARLAKRLEVQGFLSVENERNKKMYTTTPLGIQEYTQLRAKYYPKFSEVQEVIDRIYYYMTNDTKYHTDSEIRMLPDEYRNYFSKLISIKDLVRYMIFRVGQTRTEFYMGEIEATLKNTFGWIPANSYLYKIANEMEAEGTLKGRWNDPEKRLKRLVNVTQDGVIFSKQISNDLLEEVRRIHHYLNAILSFLKETYK